MISFDCPRFPGVLEAIHVVKAERAVVGRVGLLNSAVFPSSRVTSRLASSCCLVHGRTSRPLSPFRGRFNRGPPFIAVVIQPVINGRRFRSRRFDVQCGRYQSSNVSVRCVHPRLFYLVRHLRHVGGHFGQFLFEEFCVCRFRAIPFHRPIVRVVLPTSGHRVLPPPYSAQGGLLAVHFRAARRVKGTANANRGGLRGRWDDLGWGR